MSGDKLMKVLLIMAGFTIASIIPFTRGFKSGYERCMIEAVENKCAEIIIASGEIKYIWKVSATATAELK
jgi:hypothetical protein